MGAKYHLNELSYFHILTNIYINLLQLRITSHLSVEDTELGLHGHKDKHNIWYKKTKTKQNKQKGIIVSRYHLLHFISKTPCIDGGTDNIDTILCVIYKFIEAQTFIHVYQEKHKTE